MKAVEQQLVSALRDTPAETDCSISMETLRALGLETPGEQARWLALQRPAGGGRDWHFFSGYWDFAATAIVPAAPAVFHGSPLWSGPASNAHIGRIVVKPLPPLETRLRSKRGA